MKVLVMITIQVHLFTISKRLKNSHIHKVARATSFDKFQTQELHWSYSHDSICDNYNIHKVGEQSNMLQILDNHIHYSSLPSYIKSISFGFGRKNPINYLLQCCERNFLKFLIH